MKKVTNGDIGGALKFGIFVMMSFLNGLIPNPKSCYQIGDYVVVKYNNG